MKAEGGARKAFKEIMATNLPNLAKGINLQIHAAEREPHTA